ncbi:hypothetical protein [Streptomyces huiliensis]|uniref:hypothetical protein n=1 Tax=Streptomyces huiliensis TaxID=2876027 RepID=UPI001CBBD711|nr:hypothetical protein [Streptomyces huiliensis]MBZ4322439.1 hypothetical protein [Streptomyces huiliensis]
MDEADGKERRGTKSSRAARGGTRGVHGEGPGASSGAEETAHERTVPGTASAREGYGERGGTADGEALRGVRDESGEARGKRGRTTGRDRQDRDRDR